MMFDVVHPAQMPRSAGRPDRLRRLSRGLAATTLLAGVFVGVSSGPALAEQWPVSTVPTATPDPTPSPTFGPVRDGKFEFLVRGVRCGVTEVGEGVVTKQAQGEFCLITIEVRNIAMESQTFSDQNQKAVAEGGAKFDTDSKAGLVANENPDTFFANINPGNKVTGVLVFDVPKGTTLTTLELHDSLFSGGVELPIT